MPQTPVAVQKRAAIAQFLLQRLNEKVSRNIQISSYENIFTADVIVNCCISKYLSGLLVNNVDPALYIIPFNTALGKIIALSVLGSHGQKNYQI